MAACAATDDIKKINGVLGCVLQGGQLQIIIGPAVADVYAEVCTQAGITQQAAIDENPDDAPPPSNGKPRKKAGIGVIFDVFSSVFAPIVPAFAGAGIIKGLITLFTTYGILSDSTGLYTLLNAIGDSVFYFLPFIVAFTAAKRFKTNEVMALAVAGIYMYPTILGNAGKTINILGMNITCVKYASTVLPILISVWLMSYLYEWIHRHCVSFLRVVLVPIVTLLVSGFVSICFIGPIGYNLGIYLGNAFKWLFDVAPWLGGLIDGATRPLVIFTGMHMTMSTVMINNISTLGYDMLGPVHAAATMASAGMCFGAFLRARNNANRSACFSAFISAFIGITEPSLYGVAMRFKRPLIALCIGGGVSGAFVAVMNAKAVSFAMPSIISLPVYTGSIPTMLIGFVIAFVLTAALTYILGFDEGIEKDARAIAAEKKSVHIGAGK
jgi:PTS system beta-glucosides-specific IIC component